MEINVTNGRESGRMCCIEAHGDIYRVYKGNPRLDLMTILPLTPPLKCNVNAMSLHLKSGTKYMS